MKRFSDQAVYHRYDRMRRVAAFSSLVEAMLAKAAAGDPEYLLRKDRYVELRAKGWTMEQAYQYAQSEGWQRRSDVARYGACSGCGIRAKSASGEDCDECRA